MSDAGDDRLARRAAKGDQKAFAAIYERFQADLYRFSLAIVGNPQDAQDALQNTMVKALRALPGEQRKVKLKPWLYRIARNESIELIRRRRETTELDEGLAAGSEGTAATVETRERLRGLLADLAELPERQRAALVMRELGGLDFDGIGAALETSPAAARQALYEARLGLREMEGGREMTCEEAMREISDADGRTMRRRDLRAHLRSCADCRAFREAISSRRRDLAVIAPLPAAAAAGVLQAVLGAAGASAAGAAAGAGAGATGVGVAGKIASASLLTKSVATVAVAGVGLGAADRAGLVETPLPGRGEQTTTREAPAGVDGGQPSGAAGQNSVGGSQGDQARGGEAGRGAASPGPGGEGPGKAGSQPGSGQPGGPQAGGPHGPAGANGQGTGRGHGQKTSAANGKGANEKGKAKSGRGPKSSAGSGGKGNSGGAKGNSGGSKGGSQAGGNPPGDATPKAGNGKASPPPKPAHPPAQGKSDNGHADTPPPPREPKPDAATSAPADEPAP